MPFEYSIDIFLLIFAPSPTNHHQKSFDLIKNKPVFFVPKVVRLLHIEVYWTCTVSNIELYTLHDQAQKCQNFPSEFLANHGLTERCQ